MISHPRMMEPITLQPVLQESIPNRRTISKEGTSGGTLKCLEDMDGITIRQDLINDLQGECGSSNTYNVLGNKEEAIFHVVESSSCLQRWCCGPSRSFQMDVYVPSQQEPILYFNHPFCHCKEFCCMDYCCCCLNNLLVFDVEGKFLGKIIQRFSFFGEKFDVKNEEEENVAMIKGFCLPWRCSKSSQFQTYYGNGIKKLGVIQKKWMGKHQSGISFDHESSWVSFPASLKVETKALLIGAAFLLNVKYFEMS